MKQLIITADDFGLSKSINDGIAKACKEGVVSYLSLLPAGRDVEGALKKAVDMGLSEIGAHLALTEVSPVTESSKVPTLIGKDGGFHKNYARFFLNFFLGRVETGHIYTELRNQLEIIKKTGIPITSLSGHEHIHMVPAILDIFIKLAGEYGIPSIRYLGDERITGRVTAKKIYKKLLMPLFSKGMHRRLKEKGIVFTDNFLGFLDSGALHEKTLINILSSLRSGTTELVCHPGFTSPEVLDRCIFHADCETELYALTSPGVKDFIKRNGIELIKYGELIHQKLSGR